MEREPEQALLASVLDVAAHVEEDRALPGAQADDATGLLHHVERLRLPGGVRHENRCVELTREQLQPKSARGSRLSIRRRTWSRERRQTDREQRAASRRAPASR